MDLWQYLHNTAKPIVLYGTGSGADRALDRLDADGTPVAGVFASDGFAKGRSFRGFRVETYENVRNRFPDFTVLMCFGSARPEVLENAARIEAEREFRIADVPVAGDTVFDEAFYNAHIERLRQTRERLSDEESRRAFDALIRFKLTGQPRYLRASERPELPSGVLSAPSGGVILDLGAYTGDSATGFLAAYPGLGRIIAVEPEPRNYKKLCALAENEPRLLPVRALAGAAEGEAFVSVGRRGRGSAAAANGIPTPVVTVDALLSGERADLIKLDVEGEEMNALQGAARTIGTYKPKLIVSCYHRSEDLFALPELVFSLRRDYRMCFRRKRCIPAWECEFVFC
ncbi:MAG: FkbM family methyltransferase [Clostridia bacterium]|nr:FkbM family methyltransferase [Clostridia bacterium]